MEKRMAILIFDIYNIRLWSSLLQFFLGDGVARVNTVYAFHISLNLLFNVPPTR